MLERYTTRQMQPRSKQYQAQMKSDSETVLDVEMCGAVQCGMLCSSARGRIKARWSVGWLVKARRRRAAAKAREGSGEREECERAMMECRLWMNIATTATGEEGAMAGRRG